jgi:hypothetical protein
MPVGAGKSRVLKCIADWAGSGAILTPNNLLVRQYAEEWPELRPPRSRSEFGQESWARYRGELERSPLFLGNYYNYLSLRAYKPVVCFDEAHNLIPFLQEKEELKVWLSEEFPSWMQTAADLMFWAEQQGHSKLIDALRKDPDGHLLRVGRELYRGKEKTCLRVTPLTPKENRPILWPKRVKRLVLASATFDEEDLIDLGLEGRRIRFVDSDSPIPPSRRPVMYRPAASLTREGLAAGAADDLAAALKLLAHKHPDRGLVHATYGLAAQLVGKGLGDRFLFHRPDNKAQVFDLWQRSKDKILVGSGLTEGIDLFGDKARWQAVSKIVYPDQSNPAVYAKAKSRPRWYMWCAVRELLQATGRVCRGPDDFGVTYILDASFERLYNKNTSLFPSWFKQSLI